MPRLPIGDPPSGLGSLAHFRCDWIHSPSEDPVAIYYEVDELGRVLRLIDVFADGGKARACVGEDGEPSASLVEGSFHERAANLLAGHAVVEGKERLSLAPIGAEDFEAAWRDAAPPAS